MLNLGNVELPIESATKTFAVLAKRGAGKTYTACVMAEEFHKNNIPFVVFDPIDVWWGLRLNKDGESKGLPVVVFGVQDNADITLDRDMGRQIAQAVVKENVSVVISTFGLPKVAQRHLIAEFAEELLVINNTPRHIFIEEAHEFLPQHVMGAMGKTFNAVSNLVVMGRNRGIGVTLVNQRAATINKDVLTQVDSLLAFRNIAPQDRKALKEWVEHHAADDDFEAFMNSLPSLPTGEGWLWSPEFLETFKRIKIRERETFHPDREKMGSTFVMPTIEQADIQTFIAKFNQGEEPRNAPVVPPEQQLVGEVASNFQEQLEAQKAEYEEVISDLEEENTKLKETLANIVKLATGEDLPTISRNETFGKPPSNADMWIEKLGRSSGAGKMLKLLADKYPMKFTGSQLALAVGVSPKKSTYRAYMAALRRNNLISESGGYITVNPDL